MDEGKSRPRLSRKQFRGYLTKIIRRLKADQASVVLMTPNPMRWSDAYYIKAFAEHPGLLDVGKTRGIDQLLDVYAQDVRDVAHVENASLVDIFQAFEEYGSAPGHSINEILLSDGIHPNQAGQQMVCRLLTPRVAEVLARAPRAQRHP